MKLYRSLIDTPVGPMQALVSDSALCALEFYAAGRMAQLETRLRRWFADADIEEGTNRLTASTAEWLGRYFTGVAADISTLSLELRGAPFELRVWNELRKIPPGTTTTYGAIARVLGAVGASRAVGMANGANPIAIIVPCHRVVGANGTLTGYGGGLDKKSWLLNHERCWSPAPALF